MVFGVYGWSRMKEKNNRGGAMATIQRSSKDLQDLLGNFKAEEDWQLERLEDVESLTDIIREHGITKSIIQFVKKYGTGG